MRYFVGSGSWPPGKRSSGINGKLGIGGGAAEDASDGLEVGDRDVLLFAADDRDGDDRRVGLDGESHEAEAELGELVAVVEGLGDAARSLGKDKQRLALLEE